MGSLDRGRLDASVLARRAALEKAQVVTDEEVETVSRRDFFSLTALLDLLFRKERTHEVACRLDFDVPKNATKEMTLRQLTRSRRNGGSQGERLCEVLAVMTEVELCTFVAWAATIAETEVDLIDGSIPEDLFEAYTSDPIYEWHAGYEAIRERLESLGARLRELAHKLVVQAYDEPADLRYRAIRDVIEKPQWRDCFRVVRWRNWSNGALDDDGSTLDPMQIDSHDPLVRDEIDRVRTDAERARATLEEAIQARSDALARAEPVPSDAAFDISSRDFFSVSRLLELLYFDEKERLHEIARAVQIEPKRINASAESIAEQLSRSRAIGRDPREKLLAVVPHMSVRELQHLVGFAARIAETEVSVIDSAYPLPSWGEHPVFNWSVCYGVVHEHVVDLGERVRDLAREMIDASYGEAGETRLSALRHVIESNKWRSCFRLVKWTNTTHDEVPGVSGDRDMDAVTRNAKSGMISPPGSAARVPTRVQHFGEEGDVAHVATPAKTPRGRLVDDRSTDDDNDAYWAAVEAFEAEIGGGLERGHVWVLPDPVKSPRVPAAYEHQIETLRRLEHGAKLSPPVSGIVHLSTGAGKTRIALEFVARTLAAEQAHRFLWVTNAKLLIQQTMEKVVEYASMFPGGTRIAWYNGEPDALEDDNVHLTFLTTNHLRTELPYAHDRRSRHPWRRRLEEGQPLTLIFDESHHLGGDVLQDELGKFYEKVITSGGARWRVLGLSATPVPTRLAAQELLRDTLFPIRRGVATAGSEWGMHVFHRVENKELIRAGVLCPVNMHLDRSGVFDIPQEMLKRIIGDSRIKPPGKDARKDDVLKFAMKFDRDVIGHVDIVGFLADRLARNLEILGKTIVFVPSIDIANRMVAALNRHASCAGRVAAVHNKMGELRHAVPGQPARSPAEVLARFKQRGAEPCILVNVEMLTEGFDDPQVRSVVLAKMTLSTNRFWQMIGRGTRGTKSGGTTDCFVIDPIKLTRLYDYFSGYQPSVGSRPGAAIEDDLDESNSAGALDPSVPIVSRPPLPSAVPYQIAEELRRTHADVVHAIEAFLAGAKLGEQDAIEISNHVRVASRDGAVVACSGSEADTAETGSMLLYVTLARLRTSMQSELDWVRRQLPSETPNDVLRFWIRKLAAIETLGLRTEEEYARAEMDGRLARELATPVAMSQVVDSDSLAVAKTDRATDSIGCLCAAISSADGTIEPSEIEVSMRLVGRMTGAADSPSLRARLFSNVPTQTQCMDAVAVLENFDLARRRALLRGLIDVAAADSFVHPQELELLGWISDGLQVSRDYLDALIDARAD